MSILVVQIPPRERLGADGGAAAARGGDFAYVLSPDGLAVGSSGRCAAALLPRADTVLALLADTDCSWLRATLPKAPAGKLRAALLGLLEESLLDDPELVHLALAPKATPGEPTWIAATHRPWLVAQLAQLEGAGHPVERVLPAAWPDATQPHGHFSTVPGDDPQAPLRLTWCDGDGVTALRLQGSMARQLLARWQEQGARWTASPAAAAEAERWLGAPVQLLSDEERALEAARSLWNLRQFDLAPQHRGMLALRDAWRQFRSPPWRPVRWGLVSLAAAQLLGMNLYAWKLHSGIEQRRLAMEQVLRASFPQVRAVLDAPLQMDRETQALRAAAGRPGEADVESLLSAAALAWPEGRPPLEGLRFEPGRLTLPAAGWSPAEIENFKAQLRPGGWVVEAAEGRLTLRPEGGA
ncbi:type II secretion system protein GspL [Azohydromonas caseinilytica]|uniref:General secretion pathway protein GspL n=1 Tax=Azohydromonas caseinilytica TaxID=2728836 RepID=A0A848F5T8_9BURK|nr:type II secretion system protein GspL [Azohydromonas caseinilytica]NML13471.1 general secretion pathway protein GspL [Azohydromonas caseinilytica]